MCINWPILAKVVHGWVKLGGICWNGCRHHHHRHHRHRHHRQHHHHHHHHHRHYQKHFNKRGHQHHFHDWVKSKIDTLVTLMMKIFVLIHAAFLSYIKFCLLRKSISAQLNYFSFRGHHPPRGTGSLRAASEQSSDRR